MSIPLNFSCGGYFPTTFIGILSPPSPALGGLRETRSMPVYVRGDDDEFAVQSVVGRVCVKHDGVIDTRRQAVQNVARHPAPPPACPHP